MSKDRYNAELECPDCGLCGSASVVEKDGMAFLRDRGRYVTSASDGFTVVAHGTHHGQRTVIRCSCGGEIAW